MSQLDLLIAFPSGRPDRAKVERALRSLERWPVRARCPLLEQSQRWTSQPEYLCGPDHQRAEELLELWSQRDGWVVWCGRGGYGATRLLSLLEERLASSKSTVWPGRLYGYSDITALFAFAKARRLPISCIHFPVLTELPDHPAPQLLLDALQERPCELPLTHPAHQGGVFEGPIWGGNLAVLASLCGTPWLPRIEHGAIFLEDVEEAPYRLDRFLTQLHDSGFFAGTRRVLLGQFTRCGQGDAGLQLVKHRLAELGLELLGELPVGHEAYHLPLFLDHPYRLDPERSVLRPS
jgi:muramoyltetrapeptide carboxypeptidase